MSFEQAADASPLYAVHGATGGIGTALCLRLVAGGTPLAIGARDEAKLGALARCGWRIGNRQISRRLN